MPSWGRLGTCLYVSRLLARRRTTVWLTVPCSMPRRTNFEAAQPSQHYPSQFAAPLLSTCCHERQH
jgi:hypothetical protein